MTWCSNKFKNKKSEVVKSIHKEVFAFIFAIILIKNENMTTKSKKFKQ